MAQLLQAPTEGYEDAIVVPAITADNFELKHGLLNLVQNKQFFGHDKEDPYSHIRYFNKITSTLKFPNILNTSIKLMLFLFSLEGATQIWLEKELPLSIFTWDDLVLKSPIFNSVLMNLLVKHGIDLKIFLEPVLIMPPMATYIVTIFKNSFLKPPQLTTTKEIPAIVLQCCQIKFVLLVFLPFQTIRMFNSIKGTIKTVSIKIKIGKTISIMDLFINPRFSNLQLTKLLLIKVRLLKHNVFQRRIFLAYVKANDAVMRNMQTQGQNMQNQLTNLTDLLTKFVNSNNASTSSSGTLPSNTIANPRSDLKAITNQSGVSYNGPQIPPSTSFLSKVVENEPEATKDTMHLTNNRSTEDVQPRVVQSKSLILTSEPVNSSISEPVAYPVSDPRPNLRPSIPYPSRLQDQKLRDKANEKREKFFQIFKDLNFNISFADALILMPKFGPSIKSLFTNKDKLCELARTPLNEHCSAVLLKKLLEKLGDPGKFLIPCDFPEKAQCLALADLGACINLMPLSVWNKLSLPDLTPTCMTLELVDRSISHPVGVAEDVYVKVGSFHFSADFVVVDFDADPQVPLILGRSFLKTGRALIDVLEEYSQKVLGFFDVIKSGNPTPYYDPFVSTTSLTLTPFGNSDFLLEEVDAFLALENDPTSLEVDQFYLDPKRDIILLEAFLNNDPSLTPLNQGNYLPEVRKELKIYEAKSDKSSIDEPPDVELKDLAPHLEYAFLEGFNKLAVIIAKDLSVEEKTALITDFEPAVQHQRRVNPKIHDVIKQEVLKHLDAGSIYPISDSPWVSPVHCVPKKGGFAVVENKDNELILTRLVTGWRVCIAYRKLNEATRKSGENHIHMPERFLIAACLLGYAMHQARFRERMLKRCEDTNLCINWEKSHFMVKEGIVLSHKISKQGIEVDKTKVDVITKLLHPTTIKVLGQRQDKHFRAIHYASKTMTEAESNYTTIKKEMLAVVYAFEKFRSYLIMNKSIVYTDHSVLKYLFAKKDSKARLLHWVLLLQEFTFKALKHANFDLKTVGDHRKVQLNELNELRDQAYEISLIYKEKTMRLHDSKIKDRVFNIDDRVLLFNSRLKIFSGKLKSHWPGPFTISHFYPYGTVELSQPDGPNFKVNGHRIKHYFGEDVPKLVVPDLQTFLKDYSIRGIGSS
nr:reverse transcriptase domain-containing protein [Tanacetum cinerariifolium]